MAESKFCSVLEAEGWPIPPPKNVCVGFAIIGFPGERGPSTTLVAELIVSGPIWLVVSVTITMMGVLKGGVTELDSSGYVCVPLIWKTLVEPGIGTTFPVVVSSGLP